VQRTLESTLCRFLSSVFRTLASGRALDVGHGRRHSDFQRLHRCDGGGARVPCRHCRLELRLRQLPHRAPANVKEFTSLHDNSLVLIP